MLSTESFAVFRCDVDERGERLTGVVRDELKNKWWGGDPVCW